MKFPNNIIIDLNKPLFSFSNQYWIYKYLLNFKKNIFLTTSYTDYRLFLYKKENLLFNKLLKNEKKFTIWYKNFHVNNLIDHMNFKDEKTIKKLFKNKNKIKNKNYFNTKNYKLLYDYFSDKKVFNEKSIKKNFYYFTNNNFSKTFNLHNIFDINFLRKEKIYTKLKYSRVPQYDIVSGGVAALFAGFLGFLICEKFGFELIDSGDFYYLFMYLVFISFFSRLYLKLISKDNSSWNIVSLKWFLHFYKTIAFLFLNIVKKNI